jgi:hypothetical protein
MPTLEELFKSKQLPSQGGKTAEEAYAIRNSKDIRISSSNPLVNITGMLLARGARKVLGIRKDESLLEEEVTGLRVIRFGSIPMIYGSDTPRITLRTTDSISKMKAETSGEITGATGLMAKIGSAASSVKSALGLPTKTIPTFVVSGLESEKLGETQKRMSQLQKVKKSAEGTAANKLLGFIGENAGGGTPDAIGRNLVGGAISAGKQELGKKLFGSRGGSSLGLATGKIPTGITPAPSNEFPTIYTDKSLKNWGKFGFNYGSLDPTTGAQRLKEDKKGSRYSKTIIKEGDDKNDLSYKQEVENVPIIKFSAEPERASKFSNVTKNSNYVDVSKDNFLETKRGMYTISDKVNMSGVYEGEGDETLDALDFVTLKFTSLGTVSGALRSANFRATISGLSETFSPSWSGQKFIGNPFSYYTYDGIERSVSFNFKTYSLNAAEHKKAWEKLNFLSGLTYPADYYGNSAIKSPLIMFTLGDMYKKKAGFIESLSYTIDDTTPWQIMNKEQSHLNNAAQVTTDVLYGKPKGVPQNPSNNEIDMVGYRLPTIVDVAVTIKFVENRKETGTEDGNRKLYTFGPTT